MTLRPRQTGDDWRKMIRTIAGGKFTIGRAHWCYYWPSFEPINNVSLHYKLFLFFLLNEKKDLCSAVARKSCHIAAHVPTMLSPTKRSPKTIYRPLCLWPWSNSRWQIVIDRNDWFWKIQVAKKHTSEKISGSPINTTNNKHPKASADGWQCNSWTFWCI